MSRKIFDDRFDEREGAMLTKVVDGFDEFEAALRRAWEIQSRRTGFAGREVRSANRLPALANEDRADPGANKNDKPSCASQVPDPQREP
jgi:hypothetical protein